MEENEVVFNGSNHKQVRLVLGHVDDLNCRGPYIPTGDVDGYCQIRNSDGKWVDVPRNSVIFRQENGYLSFRRLGL